MKTSFQVHLCNSSTTHSPINGTVVTVELGRFGWASCVFSSAEKSAAAFLQWSTEGGQWLLGSVWSSWQFDGKKMQSNCRYSIHIMGVSTQVGFKTCVIIPWNPSPRHHHTNPPSKTRQRKMSCSKMSSATDVMSDFQVTFAVPVCATFLSTFNLDPCASDRWLLGGFLSNHFGSPNPIPLNSPNKINTMSFCIFFRWNQKQLIREVFFWVEITCFYGLFMFVMFLFNLAPLWGSITIQTERETHGMQVPFCSGPFWD